MRLPGLLRVFRFSDHVGSTSESHCAVSVSISSYEMQHVTLSSRELYRSITSDSGDKRVSALSHKWESEIESGSWHSLMPIVHVTDHAESH